MKIANLEEQHFYIFWMSWGISIKKNVTYDTIKSQKKQGFTLSWKYNFGKITGEVKLLSPALLGLKHLARTSFFGIYKHVHVYICSSFV